jgi:hypothetical protein
MPERPGRDLGAAMSLVAKHARAIPRLDGLAPAARLQWEEENVRACLHAAREMLPASAGQAG